MPREYDPVETVPEGLTWKPAHGRPRKDATVLLSLGNIYKLVRDLETGAVSYFKLKGSDAPMSSKEKIDAEPTREHRVRFRVGVSCWFVDNGRWYLVKVAERTLRRIVITPPETRMDAERQAPWTYGDALEFPCKSTNRLFRRLRPLKDRYQ